MDGYASIRPKVKVEADDSSLPEFHGLSRWTDEHFDSVRPDAAAARLWQPERASSDSRHRCESTSEVNKNGGALQFAPACPKTPKFNGKGSWEAYRAQFELLASAACWSEATKALQLALSLTEDASACLLLLNPEERGDYTTLVGALQRRFGESNLRDSLRCEFKHRARQPGESLRTLAYEIESLSRRAYADMPPAIQCELARDQFVQALTPDKLRLHVQFAHPATLGEALDLAIERETAVCAAKQSTSSAVTVAAVTEVPDQRPAWVDELVRAVRAPGTRPPEEDTKRRPTVCWGCGQRGHLLRRCPAVRSQQGNGNGSG